MKSFNVFALYIVLSLCLPLNMVTAQGADVVMAFGEKIPPYCFPKTNTGIALEVMGEALAYKGYILKPVYYPLARVPVAFKVREVDAVMLDLGNRLATTGGHYGESAVWYDNVLITLKKRNISISKPEDLTGLSVISFQSGVNWYPAWLKPVKEAGKYREVNNQELQALTLFNGRYDVVLSDLNIFKYYTNKLKREKRITPQQIQEHRFIKLNMMDYRPVFRDKYIRDDFNLGLKHLKDVGRFQAIYDKYLKD